MKSLDKIGDWIVAKPYRYYIAQWLLNTIVFMCACFTVACFFAIITSTI